MAEKTQPEKTDAATNEFERQMAVAREVMRRRKDALRELAKR